MTKIALAFLFAILTLAPILIAQIEAQDNRDGAPDAQSRRASWWARLKRQLHFH